MRSNLTGHAWRKASLPGCHLPDWHKTSHWMTDPEVLLALIFSHCFSLLLSIGKPGGVALDFQVKAITRQAWWKQAEDGLLKVNITLMWAPSWRERGANLLWTCWVETNDSQGKRYSRVEALGDDLRHQLPNWAQLFNGFKAKPSDLLGVSQKVMLGFCSRIWGSWLSGSSFQSLTFLEEQIPKEESD